MGLMESLSAFIKEDINTEELEGALNGYVKPGELTKDDFKGIITNNKNFASLFDSEVNTRRDTGVNNFMENKLPGILQEKEAAIRAEVNPKESEAAKVSREFNEYKAEVARKENLAVLKDELSTKSRELDVDFDPEIARKIASLGGDESLLQDLIAWKNKLLSPNVKNRYSHEPPKVGGKLNALSTLSDSELYAAAASHPDQKPAILEEVRRRTMPK
ncbi:MAG: hypothetical protein JRJ00_00200 [Deltaproteobacteria bacterium]|nr:hypothetical protein [Deltaproteobacteria bacterium]